MKGIILAGGVGSRLHPITQGVSKQLLPIYDKPMIYYPLSVLMLADIREILIITTPEDQQAFIRLLGDGSQWGIKLSYIVQLKPEGIAHALILGKIFVGRDDVCLVLGDNVFYGTGLIPLLKNAVFEVTENRKACIFGYYVNDPERYGVAQFNQEGDVISIEEKPQNPKSKYAVVGLYFYPNDAVQKVGNITSSVRGELEITSLNQLYLDEKRLILQKMGRGFAWLDTGTHESLMEAGSFIQTIEKRQGLKVACLEEIAFKKHWISVTKLDEAIQHYGNNVYGDYLKQLENDISYKYVL
ncbi:glucose-1-phosphate thymidylyltransferase RfbA [Ancylomarina sp. 16SWW S1-10-2]|uniref:glucose-1-phosphate thymidylyltransferase RfbA n=1 Tax=Ancylomarina sp. 16SWW S1-10-2 TaxID=2499681 RepID=UPI0012AD990E|nr:glucose-1-phosphate thymidylyltransferase RfbA [Ancylomarina sp. 16SWW S1-10-2]MRT93440.1 glucose-1-phosphate thymidylyltransferase [Ancylomarina sp. 16SWW S1-10-2]